MGKALTLAFLIIVSGCQTVPGNFCQIEKPEYLTSAEIDMLPPATARRILDRNEQGAKLCRWKP